VFSGVSDAICGELLEGRVELGLFYTPIREPRLQLEPLAIVPFVAVCIPQLVKGLRPADKLLQGLSFVGSRSSDYRGPYPVLRMLDSLGIKPKTVSETNNQEAQKQMALAGQGFTVVPKFMVQRELHEKRLVAIETTKPIAADLFLVTVKNRSLSRAAALFRALLKERLPGVLSCEKLR
jgi:DNA-binding transcriptional LysR family regulator